MKTRVWANAPGELLADVSLVLPFLSSGFYDPGSMYGGPDGVGSPPEHGDERLPDGNAYLDFGRDAHIYLTDEQTDRLVELLHDELYDANLEPQEDD